MFLCYFNFSLQAVPSFKVIFIVTIPPNVILLVFPVVVYVFSPVAEDKSLPVHVHYVFRVDSYAYAPRARSIDVTVTLYPADGIVIVQFGPLHVTVPLLLSYVPPA